MSESHVSVSPINAGLLSKDSIKTDNWSLWALMGWKFRKNAVCVVVRSVISRKRFFLIKQKDLRQKTVNRVEMLLPLIRIVFLIIISVVDEFGLWRISLKWFHNLHQFDGIRISTAQFINQMTSFHFIWGYFSVTFPHWNNRRARKVGFFILYRRGFCFLALFACLGIIEFFFLKIWSASLIPTKLCLWNPPSAFETKIWGAQLYVTVYIPKHRE